METKGGQAPIRKEFRWWFAKLNAGAVAWYVFLTLAGILLYRMGAAYAMQERGYFAIGSEAVALLLPVLYYLFAKIIRDFARDTEDGR